MEAPERGGDKLQAVLDRLAGVRYSQGAHRAYCPVHEQDGGRGKSVRDLSVREGRVGVVVYCHAGCPAADVVAALGLTWKDLFHDGQARRKQGPIDRRGMELEMLFAVERLQADPETLQRLRVGRGWASGALRDLGVGWDGSRLNLLVHDEQGKAHDVLLYDPFAQGRWKMLAGKGRPRRPWPAPERVSTVGRSRWLYLVEGEGTVISLASLGLPAVALPGSVSRPSGTPARPGGHTGAGWHPAWARRFKAHGAIVCIPDGDEQGRGLMRAAAYDLAKEGLSVTVCDPGFRDGMDIGDWARCQTGAERRDARDLLVWFVRVCRHRPRMIEEARGLLQWWHGSLSGGESSGPSGPGPTPQGAGPGLGSSPPESDLAPLWDWETAA